MTKRPDRRPAMTKEWPLLLAAAIGLAFFLSGGAVGDAQTRAPWIFVVFIVLFVTILISSFAVVRHAEHLAQRFGEPLGTLVLTLAVTTIEVANMSAVMLHGDNNPTLVRETLFSVLMIVLNGMVGLSLLFGGWVHNEQAYNLRGANAYLGVIVPLVVLSLVLPNFTQSTEGPTLSTTQQAFLGLVSVGMYGAFLAIQTGRHRELFQQAENAAAELEASAPMRTETGDHSSTLFHGTLLIAYLGLVIYMAEHLAKPIDYFVETQHAPTALGGLIIAVLVAAPEAVGAIRAALANQVQRAMNIFLGSVLSTIGLTIPVMLAVSEITDRPLELGLQHTDIVMLLITLFSVGLTFASGRTNVLQGMVHLLLFATYFFLIFQR